MYVIRHLRASVIAIAALTLIVGLSACSKKDVTEGDPAFTATGGDGLPAESAGTVGAGDAGGVSSSELETVYFAFDSYRLTSEGKSVLKKSAQWLKDNANGSIQVEGHCDERGTTEYNLALGERRANAAKDYIVRLGVESSRVSVISYGKERPQDPGHDESAWARNRRASFVVLSN